MLAREMGCQQGLIVEGHGPIKRVKTTLIAKAREQNPLLFMHRPNRIMWHKTAMTEGTDRIGKVRGKPSRVSPAG